MSSSNQTVDTSGNVLTLTRTFDAPRSLVFEAYSTCEHLKNWWGPRSWPMVECSMEFRVGGRWHYCLRGPNAGDASWGMAVYEEIVRPERLVYFDSFADVAKAWIAAEGQPAAQRWPGMRAVARSQNEHRPGP